MSNTNATVTLIGSGEFGEGMGRVYREILARIPGEPNAVFLDTPAGFELNSDAIAAKAADYFSQRLGVTLHIAGHKNQARATALELETALRTLYRADFILSGPGSPSYAIRNWRNSPVWESAVGRFENGAHLVLASAAAIAVSYSAIPVYEIYKVGEDPSWLDGMDLFAALGMKLAVVPHWNNSEGGTYDTRFCYMGETRFLELEKQLAGDVVVLGIDEYTACIFELATETCHVMGAGSVTVRCNGQEWVYASGTVFSFAQLRAGNPHVQDLLQTNRQQASENVEDATNDNRAGTADAATHYLKHLAEALDEAQEATARRDLIERAHDTMHEMSADWLGTEHAESQADLAPLIEILIGIRRELRATKQYALADRIRIQLAELDIVLEDNNAGTTWHRI